MNIFSLASGSKGNAYCVANRDALLLIDCGLSCRELSSRMKRANLDIANLAGILFTHNHIDHVRGLATFHKQFPEVKLYANFMTAEAIASATGVEEADFFEFENGQPFDVGPFAIRAFAIPHDVPDPVGYVVKDEDDVYFHATDVGTPLDSIGINLRDATIATLESNHDSIMLAQSQRPESLKQRIRGPRGHLTNDDAAYLVKKFASKKLSRLGLAHLSGECNSPHLALGAMRETLVAMNRDDVFLKVLSQDEIVAL